jgi:predicted small lipoprotein YifL
MASVFENRSLHHYTVRWILVFLVLASLMGCTSIGPTGLPPEASDIDLGPDVELRVCIYQDKYVSDKRAASIISAIEKEFVQYGLIVKVAAINAWQRPGFMHRDILRDIARRPLKQPFDRTFALVGRDLRDFAWGIFLPEVYGAVETWTHTKGYVVAEMGSLNQLLTFQSPQQAAVHEFYHMLGVEHMDGKRIICEKIARLKRLAIENRQSGQDFFPGISSSGKLYLSRDAVDRRFGVSAKTAVAGLTRQNHHNNGNVLR